MNRTEFIYILQAALLSFDGCTDYDMVHSYNLDERQVKLGIRLAQYLKFKEINNEPK